MSETNKDCILCQDCKNSFELDCCKEGCGYDSCNNFEHYVDDNYVKDTLMLLYKRNGLLKAENERLKRQLENSVVLPCLINVSSEYAVIVDRDKNGQLYKTHSYPKEAAEARLKELEGERC